MPVDSVHHRRNQGDFAGQLKGRQPPQQHGKTRRFGTMTPLLRMRNASDVFTGLMLLGSLRPAVAHATPAPPTAPALLPGAAAVRTDPYSAIPMQETTLHTMGNGAAAGCIAQPRQCAKILGGAALTALASSAVSGWVGWQAGLQRGRGEGSNACQATSTAQAQVQPMNTDDGLPAPVRFDAADVDPAQSPCDSLYAHVNHRWHQRAVLPPDQSRWDMLALLKERSLSIQRRVAEQAAGLAMPTHVEKIIADLWTTGMNQHAINAEGIAPLREELAAIDALQTPQAVEAHLHALTASGLNPVYRILVDSDMDARDTQIAYAIQRGLGLPDRSYYIGDAHAEVLGLYRAHVAHILRLAGEAPAEAERQADAVLALEHRFANASVPWQELNADLVQYYNPMNVTEADALTPGFSWSGLFQALGVPTPARFSLATPGFHQAVGAALTEVDPATWRAYLRFHTLDSASPFLGDDFVRAHHAMHATALTGEDAMPPRWKQVLAAIQRVAGEALGELYVGVAFPCETRTRVTALVEALTAALKRRLQHVPWMDAETRAAAMRRADTFRPRIGHPDQWPDWSGLHTQACGYLTNLRRADAFAQARALAMMGGPVDNEQWRMTAQEVDAYHDVMNNDIAFSAALLQPPFFDPDADDAVNYGGIGAVIGHELSHGFSDQASRFGLDGDLHDWWTQADHHRYTVLSERLAGQFDQQWLGGVQVNGTLTQGENLGDLGGLALALDALEETSRNQPDPMIDGLSRVQRFFLAWGMQHRSLLTPQRLARDIETDPHAPGPARADVGPSNLPAYAQAFQCAPDSAMTRSDSERVIYM
ncbi:M13 family metallopeptidase [uncultured Stenotrophomonas sp.]|uniref:M13 family metallopeptidase n=1 Tax=uncultured Stenotrophomonas sp. TaxID=165438 RepID=UPI0028F127A0|nr:M13 family metallopeptidase [uncultured Stenotrophomonas sp.]